MMIMDYVCICNLNMLSIMSKMKAPKIYSCILFVFFAPNFLKQARSIIMIKIGNGNQSKLTQPCSL